MNCLLCICLCARLLADGEVKAGEAINVVVPTGNFGNILAAFYAKNMGLPIHKTDLCFNENKVLYDFFTTGTYDRNRGICPDNFSVNGYFDFKQLRASDLPYCRQQR